MRKKDKLYTVNKWNTPAFMVDRDNHNIFDGFQTSYLQKALIDKATNPWNYADDVDVVSQYAKQSKNWLGISKADNPFSKGNLKNAFSKEGLGKAAGAITGALGSINTGDPRGMWDTLDPVYHLAGGRESAAGNAMSDAGVSLTQAGISSGQPYLALAGAGLKIIGGLTNAAFGSKMNEQNIAQVEGNIANLNTQAAGLGNATRNNDVLDSWGNVNMGFDFSNDFIGEDGWFSSSAKRKAEELRRKQEAARIYAARALTTGAANADMNMDNNVMSNFAALGGPLYHNRRGLFAFGGELGTNGTDWTNGLLYIDNGGSHEENPLEGIPMGFDPEGVPNLVEEGETIWNDYVFSDRIKVPKKAMKELGLGGSMGKDITFAEASKKLGKESEQRPNDPISLSGLDAAMSRLAEVQEAERMKNQMKEFVGLAGYACGGKMNKYATGSGLKKYGYYRSGSDGIGTPTGFKVGKNGRAYDYTDEYRNKVASLTADDIRKWAADHPDDESLKSFIAKGNSLENLTDEQWRTGATDGKYGFMHHVADRMLGEAPPLAAPASLTEAFGNVTDRAPEPERGLLLFDPKIMDNPKAMANGERETAMDANGFEVTRVKGPDETPEASKAKTYPTWMRYAPAFGAGVMTLTDALGLTNRPDYGMADKLEAAANAAAASPNIGYKPIGDYLTYRPMDIWYEQNRLNANSRATDRAILNSGANQGSKMAGLLASGYNDQIASGNLYRQALEYNDAKRKDVADFNRRTNMFNSQMGLEAAMANAKYQQQARQMGLSGLAQAAALRDSIDARIGAARAANLSNFLNSLGDIGRENFAMNQLNTDKSRRYTTDASGRQGYKTSTAYGGNIKRRKK